MASKPQHFYVECFIRWFVIPFHVLKKMDGGDAAFVAFSIGFSLCERFHRVEAKTQDKFDDYTFRDYAAKHLNVSKDLFSGFWDVFRNGIQHQASPKWKAGDNKRRKAYKWAISAEFPPVPVIGVNEKKEEVICIDPWGFTEHYIYLFIANPELLKDAVQHSFGHIFEESKVTIPG